MGKSTVFISDLHLGSKHPEIMFLFLNFLRSRIVKKAEAIYILGDLFEAWIGDDMIRPAHGRFLKAIAKLAKKGKRLYFMHGNRDFLVGDIFLNHIRASLIDDPSIIDLYGEKILLMHGDTLCLEDKAYLAFRAQVRQPDFIKDFLAKPISERIELAKKARMQSQQHIKASKEEIMDVSPDEVKRVMTQAHHVDTLIHGHTHRPSIHLFSHEHRWLKHYVLSDWSTSHANALVCYDDGRKELVYWQQSKFQQFITNLVLRYWAAKKS